MRVVLGTTKDTPVETTRFMLDHPPLRTRQKVEQVKAHFSPVENPHNTLHETIKDTKWCRLGRGKSWMGQAEDSILQECQLTELKQIKDWERYPNRFRRLYKTLLPENFGKHYREWPAGKTESEIKLLIQENSKTADLIVCTDGCHQGPVRWGFTVKQGATIIHEDSAAYWAIQAGLLTPLTFAWHRLSPLATFTSGAYFLHNGRRWQWICEFYTANFKGTFGGL